MASAAYMRDYRKKNPDKMKAIDLKKRFGITLEEYNFLLDKQNGVCAICSEPEKRRDHRTKKPRALAVDHNHDTGEIRGLLCTDCNTGLGLLQDDPELLKLALSYLEEGA